MSRSAVLGRVAAVAVAAVALGACGQRTAGDAATGSDRLVDTSLQPPWVTALDLDPGTGDLLLGTNRGFWRVAPDSGRLSRIEGRIEAAGDSGTVGTFLEVEPLTADHWVGSGHPDDAGALPEYLGFIETRDRGRTWRAVSRLGEADLHKIVHAHDRIYAFDAVLGAILITADGGRTFEERFTPRGLLADFVVDPAAPERMLAATDDQLYRSDDGGKRWRPLLTAPGVRLVWPQPGRIVRADQDGAVYESTDGGDSFTPIGEVDGQPYKLEATDDPRHLYMATAEAGILETTDGGRRWTSVLTP